MDESFLHPRNPARLAVLSGTVYRESSQVIAPDVVIITSGAMRYGNCTLCELLHEAELFQIIGIAQLWPVEREKK